jgi:hypothetical protein
MLDDARDTAARRELVRRPLGFHLAWIVGSRHGHIGPGARRGILLLDDMSELMGDETAP